LGLVVTDGGVRSVGLATDSVEVVGEGGITPQLTPGAQAVIVVSLVMVVVLILQVDDDNEGPLGVVVTPPLVTVSATTPEDGPVPDELLVTESIAVIVVGELVSGAVVLVGEGPASLVGSLLGNGRGVA
jgi:hypothetical protein